MQPGARHLAQDDRQGPAGPGMDAALRYQANGIGYLPLVALCINSPRSRVISSCSKWEVALRFRGLHADSSRSWISVA